MTILLPLSVYYQSEPRQAETDPRPRQRHIRDHPGSIAIITAARFFTHDSDILLALQGAGKQAGGGKRVASGENIYLPVKMVFLQRTENMPFKISEMILPVTATAADYVHQQPV